MTLKYTGFKAKMSFADSACFSLQCSVEGRGLPGDVPCVVCHSSCFWSLSCRFSLFLTSFFFLNTIWSKCFSREVSTLLYTFLFLLEFSFHYRTEEVKKYFSLNMWCNGFSSLLLFIYVFYQGLFGYKSIKSI